MKKLLFLKLGLFLVLLIPYLQGCLHASKNIVGASCRDDPEAYIEATKTLAQAYIADQKDRENSLDFTSEKMVLMSKRDEQRRKVIAELFARGCFKSAADYKNAAIIFQHGLVPENYYQSFIWAKTAARLGDTEAQHLVNLAIDRFLVQSGFKQLFATQAIKQNDNKCWCLYPVESSFSDTERKIKTGKYLSEQIEWLNTLNKKNTCAEWECSMKLKPVTKSEFPEFW
jgi:hypothetical protein